MATTSKREKDLISPGVNIRRLRQAEGLTLKELAGKTDSVDFAMLSRIEKGSNPTISTFLQLSKALKIPIGVLVSV